MKKWLRLIRDGVAMGLTWAVGCTSFGMLGVVVFYTLFPNVRDAFDPWVPVFAYPGFLGGVIFIAVLQLTEGGRKFDELPILRVAACGAVAGLLLGVVPFALGTPSAQFPLWLLVVAIVIYTTLLCTGSAVASAFLFRRLRRK